MINWDAVGAVGEVAGALLVALTLIYLVVQVRQNSKSINATITQANIAAFNELNTVLAQDEVLAEIFERGSDRPETLSEEENRRFTWLMRSFLNLYLNLYEQYLHGTCPQEIWERHALELAVIAPAPGIAAFRRIDSSFEPLFLAIEEGGFAARAADRTLEHRIQVTE